jgi:F1F0 ATPase subunit 2
MTPSFELTTFLEIGWHLLLWMLLGGFALGLFFFGSLWFSTNKLLHSRHPVLWMLGGFVVRLAIVMPSLYWLSGAQWQGLVVCLVGFIIARVAVIRITAKIDASKQVALQNLVAKDSRHASQP